jgi:hypothetical protein
MSESADQQSTPGRVVIRIDKQVRLTARGHEVAREMRRLTRFVQDVRSLGAEVNVEMRIEAGQPRA